ncbi:hypothetical protein P5G64_20165 [Serratia nevei]|uniref:hypothetical protein n=1 Tax=Serratia marcescens TaxID=615 RepID=UPI0023F7AAE8|nr:hypothetical protein [Serratia marcescens]MDF8317164.1 hypothetical protein [Serratia nevei]MDF8322813.1 hypothetical protein [Serratia nevei]MDF8339728.1 hypothetical protein [Serratia nevei]MDF8342676.1 hypothetical protein [Serratia nevei]MDF8350749.1 hypothetical protein [Serratia nevei]
MKDKKLVAGIGTNDLANNIEKQQEIGLTPELQQKCRMAWNDRLAAQDCGRATVSTEWLTYSNFARWWVATHIEGWSIDKDWLVVGNKEYHPDKCVWIPTKINNLMNDGSTNGLPKGVSIHRNSYRASCSVDGIQKYKNFKTAHDAHRHWQLWKIQEINNVLREFAFDLRLDGRVIQRLIEVRDSIQTDYDNNIETQ